MRMETQPQRMRASLRQIAERAGVSSQTVSNVLNNRSGRTSEETRQRVLSAVRELNYIPIPRPAMQNRHVETRAIGVVFLDEMKFLQDLRERLGWHTFAGMRDRAHHYQYDLLLLFRSRSNWLEPGFEAQFLDHRYDGIVFLGQCRRQLTETLVQHGLPTVVCYSADVPPGVVSVMADNHQAMELAVEHLIANGHERIAHLGGPHWSMEATQRRDEYSAALRARGREACARRIIQGTTWGGVLPESRALVEEVLALDVTAVVCGNDFLALDLWQVAEEQGRPIPESLSLIGMDNLDEGAAKGLTSIVNPFYEIGAQAIDALITLIRGGDYQEACTHIPVELISRASVCPPRSVCSAAHSPIPEQGGE